VQACLIMIGVAMSEYQAPEVVSFAAAIGFVGGYQLLMKRSWRFIRWNKRRFSVA